MKNQYLIARKSNKDGEWMFLADRNKTKRGWWTYKISTALKLDTLTGAKMVLAGLKYGNPIVMTRAEAITKYKFATREEYEQGYGMDAHNWAGAK